MDLLTLLSCLDAADQFVVVDGDHICHVCYLDVDSVPGNESLPYMFYKKIKSIHALDKFSILVVLE